MKSFSRADLLVLAVLVFVFVGLPAAWRWHADERAARTLVALARPGDILMYSTQDCPACASAKGWLQSHGVTYTECATDIDETCARRFAALGGIGVPTLQVRGHVQAGFSPVWIADVLRQPAASGSQPQGR